MSDVQVGVAGRPGAGGVVSRAHDHESEYPIYWSADRFGVRRRVWPDENGRWDYPISLQRERAPGVAYPNDWAAQQYLDEQNELVASSLWWRLLGWVESWSWTLGWHPLEVAYARRRWREKMDWGRDPRVGLGFALRYAVSHQWAFRYGMAREERVAS